jgi:hypothetical protein
MNVNKKELKKNYKKLIKQIHGVGFVIKVSIGTVYYKCGYKNCICNKDKSKRHGPYYVLTKKEKAKTISKKLSKKQVDVCKTYIENNKKLKAIIDKMRTLSSKSLDFE